uniref:natural cytotoxicity triggering receptor 1 n=1 Tax=Jaculus jaculus TaxID=51337 RepID=UPI001E1B00CA|nr:natural cytotoxicity triggering receptor 1 [Jaculus jaculus]
MLWTLTALLGLGLCLGQRTSTLNQSLSKPTVWAKPKNIIPKGKPVGIWCQGTLEASEYQLFLEGSIVDLKRPQPPGSVSKVMFLIPAMSSHTAGRYSCIYQSGELWSEPSDPLDLVVTGLYDTPSLQVYPGPQVTLGENVIFHCHLNTGTRTFFLLKEGRSNPVQHGYGNSKAEFPMGPLTRAHRGTYRCFGSYNDYIWSFPSEPVVLLVTGDVENSSLVPTDPTSFESWDPYLLTTGSRFQKDPVFWDHTTQNLIRIGLAFVVLVALVWLLAGEWLSRKRAQKEDKRGTNRQFRRRGGI